MKKSNILPSIVLGAICLVVAILLSVVNMFTAPVIAERQAAAASAALQEVLPGGSDFTELDLSEKEYPEIVEKGWQANGGFVFQMRVKGYASGLVIMCGVDADGKITGVKHIASNETFNAEGELNGAYTAKQDTLESLEKILSTSASKGAPMTSQAYYDALKAALESAILAGGGMTPEQQLQADLNTALGTTDLTFTKWFATEVIEGVDKVYESEVGKVYVIGETFVGIKADGTVVGEVDADASAKAIAAHGIIAESNPTEITELPAGVNKTIVTKASVTASGNYVFELSAIGYDAGFEYSNGHMPGNTPQPIIIYVSISSEGKIIECLTVKHSESSGYGDECATEGYMNSWTGAEKDDVTVVTGAPSHNSDLVPEGSVDLGAISSASYTTQGYQNAIKAAFTAFELLTTTEGGND